MTHCHFHLRTFTDGPYGLGERHFDRKTDLCQNGLYGRQQVYKINIYRFLHKITYFMARKLSQFQENNVKYEQNNAQTDNVCYMYEWMSHVTKKKKKHFFVYSLYVFAVSILLYSLVFDMCQSCLKADKWELRKHRKSITTL